MPEPYVLIEKLNESSRAEVGRYRRADGSTVVIKRSGQLARTRYEYNVLAALVRAQVQNVIVPIELCEEPGIASLVVQDTGSTALRKLYAEGPLDLQTVLHIADGVCTGLMGIHAAHVLHKDIHPGNIVYNPDTGVVQVIDFGISSQIAQEKQTVESAHNPEGTLGFMSPEQTGRLDRALDRRTDLYGLGATLYYLTTGHLPFELTNISELIHAIVTKAPTPPHVLNPALMRPLSDIIMKLLEKDPERRYRGARGLQFDLLRCRTLLASASPPVAFELGKQDRSETFEIPQKLYGRTQELEALRQAFLNTATGGTALVTISGPPGIGKSALVHELGALWVESGATVALGKFDQLLHHVPFSAFNQAIGEWVRRVLSLPEDELDMWRRRVKGAAGSLAATLIDLIPEMAVLIGAQQQATVELAPAETENRLLGMMRRLLLALCKTEPLVLFLDDLQWADAGTLKLIDQLMAEQSAARLTLVGAYRSTEATPSGPLGSLLARLRDRGARFVEIPVGSLGLADLEAILADTAHATDTAKLADLARVVMHKTAGNPFFTRAFINHLWEKGLFTWEAATGGWTWNVAAVEAADVTNNVIVMLTDKIDTMLPAEATALSVAACMGIDFSLTDLAAALEVSEQEAAGLLHKGLQAGLVLPFRGVYRYATESASHGVAYRFAHDRVREAAYSRLAQPQKVVTHHRIGQRLLAAMSEPLTREQVFAVLPHLNAAEAVTTDPPSRLALARLNLTGANHARNAAAHGIAGEWLQVAQRLLPETAWNEHHALVHEVHLLLAECEFLEGRSEAAQNRLSVLLARATASEQRAQIHVRRVGILSALSKWKEAHEACVDGLRELGFTFNATNPYYLIKAIVGVRRALAGRDVRTLHLAPMMTDARYQAIVDMLGNVVSAAYWINVNAFSAVVLTMASIIMEHGNSPWSALAFSVTGVAEYQQNNFDKAMQYAETALAALQTIPESVAKSAVVFFAAGWGKVFTSSPDELAEMHRDGFIAGQDAGDPLNAGWNITMLFLTLCNSRLDTFMEEAPPYGSFLRQNIDAPPTRPSLLTRMYVEAVLGLTHAPTALENDEFEEAWFTKGCEHDKLVMASFHGAKASVEWFDGNIDATAASIVSLIKGGGMQGQAPGCIGMQAVTGVVALVEQARRRGRTYPAHGRIVRKLLRWYAKLAAAGPQQWGGFLTLLHAELADLCGDPRASFLYESACERVHSSGYLIHVATTYDRTARYYVRQGLRSAAAIHARRAVATYLHYGCPITARQVAEELFADGKLSDLSSAAEMNRLLDTSSWGTTARFDKDIDLPTIMDVAQKLANEVLTGQLTSEILAGMMRVGGATRACLILRQTGNASTVADSAPGIAPTEQLINWVTRTNEPLIVNDKTAQKTPLLWKSPGSQAKCVMGVPLSVHGRCAGLIYLENDLTAEAFTGERLGVVRLLAGLTAIALENADLVARLEDMVAQRTQEVRDIHDRLVRAQQEQTEMQMAGGFAHEMRNALASASIMLFAIDSRDPGDDSMLSASQREIGSISKTLQSPSLPASDELQAAREALARLQAAQTEIQTSVAMVDGGIARALKVTEQILRYAEVTHLHPADDATDLATVVNEVLAGLEQSIKDKNITARVEFAGPVNVYMKPEHAKTIVNNLLNNSIDAVASRGQQETRSVVIKAQRHQGRVALQVIDSGVGMAAPVRARVFEPFFSTKGALGTGLGLGLSRKLAQVYGGDITFTSEADKGSTFEVGFVSTVSK